MTPISPAWISLLLLLGLGVSACGPGRAVQKYDYLTEDAARYNREEPDVASPGRMPDREPSRPTQPDRTSTADLIVQTALSYQGVPYRYGGTSRQGMDCSGLINVAYQAADRYVPRSSSQIAAEGDRVKLSKVIPGDLLLFSAKGGTRIDHVGLVVEVQGDEVAFIHATTSAGVRVDRLTDTYWDKRFRKAVRF